MPQLTNDITVHRKTWNWTDKNGKQYRGRKPKWNSRRKVSSNIRAFHQSRPSQKRQEDERTTEQMTNNPQKWLDNPDQYDWFRVDEALPDKYRIGTEHDEPINPYFFKLQVYDKTSNYPDLWRATMNVGHSRTVHSELRKGWVSVGAFSVEPKYQGQGLGNILLREVTNYLDKEKKNAHLITFKPELVPLYQQYGFRVRRLREGKYPIYMERRYQGSGRYKKAK